MVPAVLDAIRLYYNAAPEVALSVCLPEVSSSQADSAELYCQHSSRSRIDYCGTEGECGHAASLFWLAGHACLFDAMQVQTSELRRGLLTVASSVLLSSAKLPQVQQRLRMGPEELQVGATADLLASQTCLLLHGCMPHSHQPRMAFRWAVHAIQFPWTQPPCMSCSWYL